MVAVSALFSVITRLLVGVRGGSPEDPLEYRGVKSVSATFLPSPHSKKNNTKLFAMVLRSSDLDFVKRANCPRLCLPPGGLHLQ